MKLNAYLVIQGKPARYGPDRANKRDPGQLRITKNKPDLNADEISIKLNMEIPDALFVKPTLTANISVPENQGLDTHIDCEMAENISQAVSQMTGFNIRLVDVEGEE